MLDALSVLRRLNVSWKRIGSYNMKCRWLPPERKVSLDMNHIPFEATISDTGVELKSQNAVKFEMQVRQSMRILSKYSINQEF